MKKLDILIPTFNRKNDLEKNLKSIIIFLTELNLSNYIDIYVSDNASTDGTYDCVRNISEQSGFPIFLFKQDKNIGFANNLFFLLSVAKSDYVMTLGDDDFFNRSYLEKVFYYLNNNSGIKTILPNCYNTRAYKYRTPIGKDIILGYPRNLSFIFCSTQLSGLVFLREGLVEKILQTQNRNLYLQVFCVGNSLKQGKAVHILSDPIEVSMPNKKDWSYTSDYLMDDKFSNLVMLNLNYLCRANLESKEIISMTYSFICGGFKKLFCYWKEINKGKNITVFTKVFFLFYVFVGLVCGFFRRIRFLVHWNKDKFMKKHS